jgi:hypothetical protein
LRLGDTEGTAVGMKVGVMERVKVGIADGFFDGPEGLFVGAKVGILEGDADGPDGAIVGEDDGDILNSQT